MWTVMEASENLNADEHGIFVRSHRMFGKSHHKPHQDVQTYREEGIIPSYVAEFLDYHEKRRAIG